MRKHNASLSGRLYMADPSLHVSSPGGDGVSAVDLSAEACSEGPESGDVVLTGSLEDGTGGEAAGAQTVQDRFREACSGRSIEGFFVHPFGAQN